MMPIDLSAENQLLRHQLTMLLEQAHRNQQILRRHQQADLEFIGAGSFEALLESLFGTLAESSELDVITLTLLDPDYKVRQIIAEQSIDLNDFPELFFINSSAEFGEMRTRIVKPLLGAYQAQLHSHFFPNHVLTPASVATVPLIRHNKLIGCLGLGSLDTERFTPTMGCDFIEHLASIVAICVENVISNEKLKHIGLTDPLTGVNNRRYVERRLQEEIGRSRRKGYALSCMYIDIDHFKNVNDTIGHQGGDEVLREVAVRIKAELRISDALARFGGEEFVVLLIDTQASDAVAVAERIRSSIGLRPIRCNNDDQHLGVTVSIGIAMLSASDENVPAETIALKLIGCADQALYQAKETGRNRVVVHDQ